MEKFKSLIAIYFLFLLLSIVTAYGINLIDATYSNQAMGALLILSSIITLAIFIREFIPPREPNPHNRDKS